ncbi:MAG: hypothetical protein Q9218_005039 [Villophora microphyllina]
MYSKRQNQAVPSDEERENGTVLLDGQDEDASVRLNNTYVHDASSPCDPHGIANVTPVQCSGLHGGFFDEGSSTSWTQVTNFNVSGAAPDLGWGVINPALAQDVWGVDSLKLNSTLVVEDLPVGIMRVNPEAVNIVGLGRNSTLLNALFSMGMIASRTWAIATGWQGADSTTQTDGSVVIGGYDSAQTIGPNVTYPFAKDDVCQGRLLVTISNIVLNLKNGSSPSLLPPSEGSALRACVSPDSSLMTLSEDIFNRFLDITGYTGDDYPSRSDGLRFWGMVFNSTDAYDGDMTFTLSSGLNIRIPNHQLVLPDYSVNAQGFLTIDDPSVREVTILSLVDINKNDMPILGQPFLSSAYLFVDHDHEQFTLWASNRTSTEQKLVPIGPGTCRPSASIATPFPTSTAQTPTVPPPRNSNEHRSISTGGIVGIVIGSLAALAIISLLLVRYLRRRHPRTPPPPPPHDTKPERQDARLTTYLASKPEMPSDRQPPQEMPLEQHAPYTIAPHEMPAEQSTGLLEQRRWEM